MTSCPVLVQEVGQGGKMAKGWLWLENYPRRGSQVPALSRDYP